MIKIFIIKKNMMKILQNQLWMNNLKNERLLLLKIYCVVVKITLIIFFSTKSPKF